MMILVQEMESHLYLTDNGGWNPLRRQARNFATPEEAYAVGKSSTERHIQVLLHFPFVGCSIPVLVPASPEYYESEKRELTPSTR